MEQTKREGGDPDLVRLYLNGIGRYPLLTKDDEARLAQAIEEGRAAGAELAAGKATPQQRRRLRRVETRGRRAAEDFTNSNLRLVVSIAKRYQASDLPLLDLIQEGNLGLMHAVEKFDWRKGFKFSTYATWWIRQAIGRGIDNGSRTVRLPVHAGDQLRRLTRVRGQLEGERGHTATVAELAEAMALSEAEVGELLRYGTDQVSLEMPIGPEGDTELGEVVSDANAPTPFDMVVGSMLGAEVDKLLAPLDEREREILRLRYGLDQGEERRTLGEVGEIVGLTRERVRQIESAALAKLRHPSAGAAGGHDLLAS